LSPQPAPADPTGMWTYVLRHYGRLRASYARDVAAAACPHS
jgi:hypothetical protein